MELFITLTSPYARKARIVVRERTVVVHETLVNPHEDDRKLLERSPLGRVPVLWTEAEGPILDSRNIVRYLDEHGSADRPAFERSWKDATLEAMAEGVLDSCVTIVMERRRPSDERSEAVIARQSEKIARTLEVQEVPEGDALTLGKIGLACALGYLDFRLPEIIWRERRADLADWYAVQAQRPSFSETMPPQS